MSYEVPGGCVDVRFLVLGALENDVYIISDEAGVLVVDPSREAPRILEALDGRALDAIVITHAHWDHVGAAAALRKATGAPVIASAVDAPVVCGRTVLGMNHRAFKACPVDRVVEDEDVVEVGSMKWQVIETPGHTPGGICLYLDPAHGMRADGAPVLVSGDTLFAGTHGRTDFEGGSPAAMRRSLQRLAELPANTVVLPGHNNPTTIGREKPWMMQAAR